MKYKTKLKLIDILLGFILAVLIVSTTFGLVYLGTV